MDFLQNPQARIFMIGEGIACQELNEKEASLWIPEIYPNKKHTF
jgi:hypothetical protein